jgi:hypothetical protein
MFAQRLMWIVWPAFLTAAVLEMIVFAFIDPSELHWGHAELGLSRSMVYTVSFFVFWVVTIVSSSLTTLLAQSPFEVNRCPLPFEDRPVGCPKSEHCSGA